MFNGYIPQMLMINNSNKITVILMNHGYFICMFYSTVTDFARFLGLSMSQPFKEAT